MKKLLLSLALLLGFACAYAQEIKIGEEIPVAAADILRPRLVQMLEAGGVADVPLEVSARIARKMETPGSMAQVALNIILELRSGSVSEEFPLKGVGETEADAWQRAMKQFLPKGKAVQAFIDKIKDSE